MRFERIYERMLRFYPVDYRVRFASEMWTAFEQAIDDRRRMARITAVRFFLAESGGLAAGVVCEWVAKLTSDRAARGRCLPDCRFMRPPGVTREQWGAGLEAIDISRRW